MARSPKAARRINADGHRAYRDLILASTRSAGNMPSHDLHSGDVPEPKASRYRELARRLYPAATIPDWGRVDIIFGRYYVCGAERMYEVPKIES